MGYLSAAEAAKLCGWQGLTAPTIRSRCLSLCLKRGSADRLDLLLLDLEVGAEPNTEATRAIYLKRGTVEAH